MRLERVRVLGRQRLGLVGRGGEIELRLRHLLVESGEAALEVGWRAGAPRTSQARAVGLGHQNQEQGGDKRQQLATSGQVHSPSLPEGDIAGITLVARPVRDGGAREPFAEIPEALAEVNRERVRGGSSRPPAAEEHSRDVCQRRVCGGLDDVFGGRLG